MRRVIITEMHYTQDRPPGPTLDCSTPVGHQREPEDESPWPHSQAWAPPGPGERSRALEGPPPQTAVFAGCKGTVASAPPSHPPHLVPQSVVSVSLVTLNTGHQVPRPLPPPSLRAPNGWIHAAQLWDFSRPPHPPPSTELMECWSGPDRA